MAVLHEVQREQGSGNTAGCTAHGPRARFTEDKGARCEGTSLGQYRGQIDPDRRSVSKHQSAIGRGSSSGRVDQSRPSPRRNTLDQERSPEHVRRQRGSNNASQVPVQVRDTSTRAGSDDYTTNLVEAGGAASQPEGSRLYEGRPYQLMSNYIRFANSTKGFAKRTKPRKFFKRGKVVRPRFD